MAGEGASVPYQAPPVMPMDEAASKQQQELGRAMIAAGNTAYRLGSAIQDDIDDAATKEADTAFLKQAQDIMRGKSGYLNTTGKDAEASFQTAQDAMASAAKNVMDGLGNDTQRRMFQQVASRNMVSFQGQMLDHRNSQVKNYAIKEAIARADTYCDQAILSSAEIGKTDDPQQNYIHSKAFSVNMNVAFNEVNKAADLLGLPQDSAQRTAMVQQLADKIGIGVVADLMQRNKFNDAEYYATNSTLSPALKDKMISSIESNRERAVSAELTRSVIDRGVLFATSNEKEYPGLTGNRMGSAAPPADLREALAVAGEIEDPVMRRVVMANVRQEFEEAESLRRQEYTKIVNAAENWMASGRKFSDMPQQIANQLAPKDQARYKFDQVKIDEIGVLEDLAAHPNKLTQDYLLANRGKLTSSKYVELLNKLNKPDEILAASADAQLVNATLVNAGLMNLINPKTDDDKRSSYLMRAEIEKYIDLAQQRKGGKLTRPEQQLEIDRVIKDRAMVDVPWYKWGFDYERPVAAMTDAEFRAAYISVNNEMIPLSFARQAKIKLQKHGLVKPSDIDIYEYWVKKGKPSD
jgi:hypothetical protein